MNEKFISSCSGKSKFHTPEQAAKARKRMVRNSSKEGNTLQVYRCQYGNHWHVGNSMGPDHGERTFKKRRFVDQSFMSEPYLPSHVGVDDI